MFYKTFEDLASEEFEINSNSKSSFQQFRNAAMNRYSKMSPEELKAEQLDCELQLSECDDDNKRQDNSVAQAALFISILSLAGTSAFSVVNNFNGTPNEKLQFSANIGLNVIIAAGVILAVLAINFIYVACKRKSARNRIGFLRFKLECIKALPCKQQK